MHLSFSPDIFFIKLTTSGAMAWKSSSSSSSGPLRSMEMVKAIYVVKKKVL